MGNKAGYAETILAVLGLRSGLGADAYAWAEADDGVRALLRCYPDAAILRRVADIIRGWADEEPRILWERLRAEQKARPVFEDADGVAAWTYLCANSFRAGFPDSGIFVNAAGSDEPCDYRRTHPASTAEVLLSIAKCIWPSVAVFARIPAAEDVAAMLGTPGDLEGAIIYMDPPYQGTTGYRHELGRDEVVAIARDYATLGAVVCISEAEPLAALGWEAVEVTCGRKGQKRTFSKQQAEWLTMNCTPSHRIARQVPLFGGAA
jgi:hypothetical protein